MQKKLNKNKGQITLVNLFAFAVTIFVWAVLAPVIEASTLPVVAYFEENPNEITPGTLVLVHLISFVLILSIILSIINQAVPRREGYYG